MSHLGAVVEHDRRLAILDLLDARQPMTIAQLADVLGWPVRKLGYHVRRLDARSLVSRRGCESGRDGIERRYAVDLAEQPEPVRDAVEDYRQKLSRSSS